MKVQNISFKDNLINKTNQSVSQHSLATPPRQSIISPEKSWKQKTREVLNVAGLGIILAVGGYLAISSIVGQHKLAKNVKIILSKIGEKKKPALKKILHKFSLDQKVALTNVMVENICLLKEEPNKFIQIFEQKSKEILTIKHNSKKSNSDLTDSFTDLISTILDF